MHPDIEKLINIAKETGELTEKQKEIILRKAEKLGEDVDEVEFVLESPSHHSSDAPKRPSNKGTKCPNCGATIRPFQTKCEECGFILHLQENDHALALADRYQQSPNKVSFIYQIVSPNSVEELTETISFLIPLFECQDSIIAKAAIAKAKGILFKAKQIAKKSNELTEMVEDFEDKIKMAGYDVEDRGVYTTGSIIALAIGAIASVAIGYFEWTLLDWKPIWRIVLMAYTAWLPFATAKNLTKKKEK